MAREPILLLTALYLALVYSMQSLFFQSNPVVYGEIYCLSEDLIGLSYIPSMSTYVHVSESGCWSKLVLVGVTCGFLLSHFFGRWYTRAEQKSRTWATVPEYRRLPLACIGAP